TFGSSRELTPALTPWDTATFWTRSFVSSAKHFATDIYNTFTLSHPTREGVITTGTRDWTDYAASSELVLELHETVGLVLRARGHRRYYAGIVGGGKASIIRRSDDEARVLATVDYAFEPNSRPTFEMSANGDDLAFAIGGRRLLTARDGTFRSGGAGFLI